MKMWRRPGRCSQSAFQMEGVSKAGVVGFLLEKMTCRQLGQLLVFPRPLRSHFFMHSCPKICLQGSTTGWCVALKGSVQTIQHSTGCSCVLMKLSMAFWEAALGRLLCGASRGSWEMAMVGA
jgi:hypothetical protein